MLKQCFQLGVWLEWIEWMTMMGNDTDDNIWLQRHPNDCNGDVNPDSPDFGVSVKSFVMMCEWGKSTLSQWVKSLWGNGSKEKTQMVLNASGESFILTLPENMRKLHIGFSSDQMLRIEKRKEKKQSKIADLVRLIQLHDLAVETIKIRSQFHLTRF